MTIFDWISNTSQQLSDAKIDSARLDAELILANALSKPREWLLAHDDEEVTPETLKQIRDDIIRRLNHEPLAYILGKKEFYGRELIVTSDVLIPRPETEQLIEVTKIVSEKPSLNILDIGTGSGALAITLALEIPDAHVTASDISDTALKIARQNATKLNAKIDFLKSYLLDNINEKFDIIVANLPYVDKNWQISPETNHEPEIALFADDGGLDLIKKLIQQAPKNLTENGFLILEMDPRQTSVATKFAEKYGFVAHKKLPFALILQLRSAIQPTKQDQ